jgi:hypothetical protein
MVYWNYHRVLRQVAMVRQQQQQQQHANYELLDEILDRRFAK